MAFATIQPSWSIWGLKPCSLTGDSVDISGTPKAVVMLNFAIWRFLAAMAACAARSASSLDANVPLSTLVFVFGSSCNGLMKSDQGIEINYLSCRGFQYDQNQT